MTKDALRSLMKARRRTLVLEDKTIRDQDIISQLRKDDIYQKSQVVAVFYPMKDEIDLRALFLDEKIFLLPRVNKEQLDFYVHHKDMIFETSQFGVKEPQTFESLYQGQIDLIIVPALAISKDLNRVGYGKGFYDRFIKSHKNAYTIGVIYDFQYVDDIEVSSFDMKLDKCIKGSL